MTPPERPPLREGVTGSSLVSLAKGFALARSLPLCASLAPSKAIGAHGKSLLYIRSYRDVFLAGPAAYGTGKQNAAHNAKHGPQEA